MSIDPSLAVREGRQLDMVSQQLTPTGTTVMAGAPGEQPGIQVAGGGSIAARIAQRLIRPLVGKRALDVGQRVNVLEKAAKQAEKEKIATLARRLEAVRENAPSLTAATGEVGQSVFVTNPEDYGIKANGIGTIVGLSEETGLTAVQFTDPVTQATNTTEFDISNLHAAPLEIVGEDASTASARAFFKNLEGENIAQFISERENKPVELVKVPTGKTRKAVDETGNVKEIPLYRHAYQFVLPEEEARNATLAAVHDIAKRDELFDSFSAFNKERMDATPNIFALIEQQSKNYSGLIETQTRGVVTEKAQREVANILGRDPQSLAKALLKRQPGDLGGWTPERTLAARDFLIVATENLDELARKAQSANEASLLSFAQFQAFHGQLQASILGLRAEAGRLLGSWRQQAGANVARKAVNLPADFIDRQTIGANLPESEMAQAVIHDTIEKFGGAQEILNQVDAYLKAPTLAHRAGVVRLVQKQGKISAGFDAFYEAWINLLFSAPPTHLKNIIGTFYTTTSAIPSRYLAGTVGKALRKGLTSVGMSQEGTDEVFAEEAQDMMYAYFATQKDALKSALLTLRTGEQQIAGSRFEIYGGKGPMGGSGPYKLGRSRAWSAESLGATGVLGATVEMSGHVFTMGRIPTKMLSAEDMYFKTIAQRMELHAQAARLSRRLGLAGEDRAEFMAAFITNPESGEWGSYKFAELGGSEIVKKTHDEARYSALQRELGDIGKAARQLARLPILRYFIPVITTPINSFLWGVRDHSPFALMSKEWRNTIAQGGAEADLALGRLAFGTSIIGVVSMLTWLGLMNGSPPSDPQEKRAWKLKREKPFSFRLGDKAVTFRWFEPLATQIGVAVDVPKDIAQASALAFQSAQAVFSDEANTSSADLTRITTMAELVETGHVSEEDWKKFVAMMALHIGQNVTSATYMSGFSKILHAIDNPNIWGARALEGLARTMVPRIVGSVAAALDPMPVRRRVDGLIQAVQSQIPYWREGLRPEIDFLGRMTPLKVMGGDDAFNRWLNPLHYSIPNEEEPIINAMLEWQATPADWPDTYKGVSLDDDQIYQTRTWAGQIFHQVGNAYATGESARITVLEVKSERGDAFDFDQDTVKLMEEGRGPGTGKTYEELSNMGAKEGIELDLAALRVFAWQQAIARLIAKETDFGKRSWRMQEKIVDANMMKALKRGNRAELIEMSKGDASLRQSLMRLRVIPRD